MFHFHPYLILDDIATLELCNSTRKSCIATWGNKRWHFRCLEAGSSFSDRGHVRWEPATSVLLQPIWNGHGAGSKSGSKVPSFSKSALHALHRFHVPPMFQHIWFILIRFGRYTRRKVGCSKSPPALFLYKVEPCWTPWFMSHVLRCHTVTHQGYSLGRPRVEASRRGGQHWAGSTVWHDSYIWNKEFIFITFRIICIYIFMYCL